MKRFSIIILVCTALSGCRGGTDIVNGTVNFDDHPLKDGSITFISIEGDAVREGAIITDGKFQVKVPPGKYRIEVHAKKVLGTRTQKGFDDKMEEVEITGELIPDRYNAKSDLVEEIKRGREPIKLDLKSGEGKKS